jgi:hypothetical protein
VLRQQYDAGLLDHLNDKTAWEKARETALKRCKGDRAAIKETLNELGPAPESPLHPMMLLPEPTFEGLIKHFAVGQPNLGLFSGEGGQFVGGYSMGDDRKLATAAGLSALWDGEPIRRVRASDGVVTLAGRRLALHLMVQPEVANILLSDQLLAGQGLLSRLLVTAPESTIGARLWRDEKPETDRDLRRYHERMLSILKIPTAAAKTNELKPRALPLSAQARKLFKRWHDHVERRIAPGGELEPVKGFAAKLPEHATRLAAVSTIIADVHAAEIGELELQAGLTLAEYYATEALRLFGVSRINADLQLARKLLHWLHSQWSEPAVSLPDIYQRGPNAINDQATARKMVVLLEDHGVLQKLERGAIVAGRRRRDAWLIVRG